ncbi:MAG: hypothetical protein NC395_08130 [Prevotella sp.]|nr:hypothetical protein [Prevotella sp.]
MDEFNNAPNPFNENNNGETPPQNPYNAQPDPYNSQPGQGQPYGYPPPNGYNYNRQDIPQNGYVPPQGMQGYAPQQGYAPVQGYGMPYQQPSTGMATASLVLGIISICVGLFMFSFPFLFLLPIIGLILGIVFKCKRLPVGKGVSTAGIITSAIGLAIPIALLVFVMVMLVTNGAELMEYLKQMSPEQYEQLYELYGDQFPQWFSGAAAFLMKLI